MAIDTIQLPTDGTGKKIAARSYTESSNTVYAQAGYLTTDSASGNPAAVQNTVPAGTEYGLVTRSLVSGTQPAVSTTNWTSATSANTANTISVAGYNTVTVAMHNTSTMTAGVLTFEVSPDGTNWFPIQMGRIDSFTVDTTYTLNTVADRAWSTSVDGFTNFRVRLSTAITGTGTASVFVTAQTFAIEPIISAGLVASPGAGGVSSYSVLSAATNNAAAIKTTPGQVYGWVITNTNATVRYVKLYNKASSPAPATDNALLALRLAIPGAVAGAAGMVAADFSTGIYFSTGIGIAAVTGASDTDNTAVAASELMINVLYK